MDKPADDGVLKWGQLTKPDIATQFTAGRFDGLSFTTTPLRLFSKSQYLGHASGFFWRHGDQCYLVTNWHVVSGNNPFTRRALGSAPPSHLVAYDIQWLQTDCGAGLALEREERQIQLFNEEAVPVWIQHPKFDECRIDVVAIPLPQWAVTRKQGRITCVNDYGFERLPSFSGSELFVVGYPLSNFEGWMLPLWKRGSFASDPLIPVNDRPVFMIDVLSAKGMSGSPVFRRVFGPRPSADLTSVNAMAVVTTKFVGIYAGRLEAPDFERVGLGYAWYGNMIGEILDAQVRGTTA